MDQKLAAAQEVGRVGSQFTVQMIELYLFNVLRCPIGVSPLHFRNTGERSYQALAAIIGSKESAGSGVLLPQSSVVENSLVA